MQRKLAWLLAAAMILGLSACAYAEDTMTYQTQEIWCDNNGQRIYGVAYIPDGAAQVPLIIFSHELGNSHTTGIPYAERLAVQGYAVYTFLLLFTCTFMLYFAASSSADSAQVRICPSVA